MSFTERMNAILQKYGLQEKKADEPPETKPDEPDIFDQLICPKCGCNDWDLCGPVKKKTTYRRRESGFRYPINRIYYPLKCDYCNHRWSQLVIEE